MTLEMKASVATETLDNNAYLQILEKQFKYNYNFNLILPKNLLNEKM